MPDAPPPQAPKPPANMGFLLLSLGLVMVIMLNEGLRVMTGRVAGFVLDPVIGFGGTNPILTIFAASLILVMATTVLRHYMTDWVEMARVQEVQRVFRKEKAKATKDNNTYKIKQLTAAEPQIMQMQMDMMPKQMRVMPFTMIIVIPIFAWLFSFIDAVHAADPNGVIVRVPWNLSWSLIDTWWLFPRWILLYSLFGIPFGQAASRLLKMWEFRRHDLDGDGIAAGDK